MCISARPAEFFGTTLLMSERHHPRLGNIVVAGYQNTARNNYDGPNAMLLHFPAGERVTKNNLLDTRSCKRILADMRGAVEHQGTRGGVMLGAKSASFEVFEYDIYTVVLTTDPRNIPEALRQVPAEKRPTIGETLLSFYAERFPGWSYMLCCFNNREEEKASPLLWWYKPIGTKRILHAPALDSHTGEPPDLNARVPVDHCILMAADGLRDGADVRYRDRIPPELAHFLPKQVIGRTIRGTHKNGDFWVSVESVKAGDESALTRGLVTIE